MVRLKCQCCGFEQLFENGQRAFQAGWDAPPIFTQHVCCPLCPASAIVLKKGHKIAHAIWKREGRPRDFSIEKCGTDDIMGEPEKIAKAKAGMKAIEEALK